jgi:hypothetical protein
VAIHSASGDLTVHGFRLVVLAAGRRPMMPNDGRAESTGD